MIVGGRTHATAGRTPPRAGLRPDGSGPKAGSGQGRQGRVAPVYGMYEIGSILTGELSFAAWIILPPPT
jgi:hypothetical protein